jgi:hypothetical protein
VDGRDAVGCFYERERGLAMTKFRVTTPSSITPEIVAACRTTCPQSTPSFIPIQSMEAAKPDECHRNVARVIEQRGGSSRFGWSIWQSGELWLEFMFHSIWRDPEGVEHDITPDPDGERQRLFLPDPIRIFEGRCVPTRYFPLSDSVSLARTLKNFREAQGILCRYRSGEPLTAGDAERYRMLQLQRSFMLLEMERSNRRHREMDRSRAKREYTPNCGGR